MVQIPRFASAQPAKRQWKQWLFPLSLFTTTILSGFPLFTLPLRAAESVVIRQGFVYATVSVEDLKEFAETGKVPVGLLGYFSFLKPEQKQQALGALNIKIKIKNETVEEIVNSQVGTRLLTDIDTIISSDKSQGGTAIKTAILSSAQSEQGLSVINFLENYPLPTIEINLPRAFAVLTRLNQGFWQTQRLLLEVLPKLTPEGSQAPSIPFDPSKIGPGKVEITRIELLDKQRDRNIPVYIYSSSTATPDKPLILYSHGRGSDYQELRYLMEHLASHGYTVIVPEHPGSNATFVNKNLFLSPTEVIERPQDLIFTLNELEKLNISDPRFKGKFNTNNTLVFGYSFGGATALALAGGEFQIDELRKSCDQSFITFSLGKATQCLAAELPNDRYRFSDPRIKRAISFAPTASVIFGKTGLNQVQVPTVILTQSSDKVTPALTEQIAIFPQIKTEKLLLGVLGATHLSVRDPGTIGDQTWIPVTPISGGEIVGDASQDVKNYAKAMVLATAAQMTPEAEKYQIFLTPEYYRYISTPTFPVRLITDIPPDIQVFIEELLKTQY
ncbi:MAG: alpha/beta hydrolase [Planktothrix sp.]